MESSAVGAMLSQGKRDRVTWGSGVRNKSSKLCWTCTWVLSARSAVRLTNGEICEINRHFRTSISTRRGALTGKSVNSPGGLGERKQLRR